VERTKIIFHLISCENEDVIEAYTTIRKELEKYNEIFKNKKEYVILSKTDLKNKKEIASLVKQLKTKNKDVATLSMYDYDSMEKLQKLLSKINNQKQKGRL